mmetsp:Transcript_36588/g.88185  ORF Transcript_36588/g.88185 Transcript_36588/m.88185 type:complete len:377 (+) Transcript_36588:55-1185(+)
MNKMANVFYPKKAKAKMRARKRKMQKANDKVVGDGKGGDDIDGNREHEATTTDNGSGNHQREQASGGRKRAADEITNGKHHRSGDVAATAPTTVVVPADLTPKDAKKFRKDARRKARAEGQSDDRIKFVVEGQEPEDEPGNDDDDKRDKRKKAKRTFPRINDMLAEHATQQKLEEKLSKQKSLNESLSPLEKRKYVAVDCEMVGVGIDGKKSALARASVVDWDGAVLLDAFVRVPERVTDFRTFVSGVRAKDINVKNADAIDHEECRTIVGELLVDKILVGHALKNDLAALMLSHPRAEIRDTARYKPFMRPSGRGGGKLRPRKLRDLVHEQLGRRIQVEGEAHCSVDDARASMDLFKAVRGRWEKELMSKKGGKK